MRQFYQRVTCLSASNSEMAGTLYTYPDSFRAYKVLIAAQYSGTKVKVAPNFELGKTNRSPDFLKKFPLGKVPAFETADGKPITESNAIAYYVANGQLRGSSDLDAALVLQYVNFADFEILPAVCTWTFPTLGIMQPNQQAVKQAQDAVKKCLEVLDASLATKTFLVGERVTLADITLVCNLLLLYKQVLDPQTRAPYVNVNRWFVTCINQPQFKAVLGEVTLCTKMAHFDAKKYNELFPNEKKEKKGGSENKAQAKTQVKKQDKKPKQQPEPAAEDQEDDAPKPKKFQDPYLSLPPSPFVLDQFKRVYSNEDIEQKAVPFLWENFDKEGWSLWRADYNYNTDLKMSFMAANLLGGMFQRLDKLHKYAFASMLIFGEDYKLTISGVWILRGPELAFSLVEDWNVDAESYTFTKLDPDNEEHRKMVNEFLIWKGDFGGRGPEPIDGKIFKKDHVSRELQASRRWPDKWGVLAVHHQPSWVSPGVGKCCANECSTMMARLPLQQGGPGIPETSAREVGLRHAQFPLLEMYGRHARGQHSIEKQLNWPREGIM